MSHLFPVPPVHVCFAHFSPFCLLQSQHYVFGGSKHSSLSSTNVFLLFPTCSTSGYVTFLSRFVEVVSSLCPYGQNVCCLSALPLLVVFPLAVLKVRVSPVPHASVQEVEV